MMERHEGSAMRTEHMKKGWMIKKMLWEQLDDDAKRQYVQRKLDERIMEKKCKIKLMQHKLETLQMLKTWLQK